MKKYSIQYTDKAEEHIKHLKKKHKHLIPKLGDLLKEIENHPQTGTGQNF